VASDLAEPPDRSPDRRLGALFDRYLWIVPVTAGHRVSLGGACLLLLALVVQLAAKMVDLEPRTFGRCMLVGTLAFAGMLAELCLAPVHPLWLVGLGIVNVLGWLLATRCVFGARGWSGLGMLVCLTLAILVGVLLLEISGFLLGGHQTA
jgi:hypothetical protein